MSQHALRAPNDQVRAVYERLGDLVDQSDDAFVEEGPAVLQRAMADPEFFDGVEADHAPSDDYTRTKVVGDPGRHVIRYMEWPPGYSLPAHEHHGRPCFEVLVDGSLHVVDMAAEPVATDAEDDTDDRYTLSVVDADVTDPGEAAVVDPRENEVHAVYSPVRSRSLHVYPDDECFSYGYVATGETTTDGDDVYARERFDFDD
ncbi:hypothetical protein [Haloarchaeobius sp. DFWS5]|uniref:hypothetical protein n=1 Tax=Haloarchaeobius sp. DFWS5 TaxID=3446114 RepID=UPI003EBAF88E